MYAIRSYYALGKTNDYGNITYNLASLTMDWEVGDHVVTWVSGYNDSNKKAGTENDRAHYVTNPEQLTNQRTRTKAVITSYSIHYTKLYEASGAGSQWQLVGAIRVLIRPEPVMAWRTASAPSWPSSLADLASRVQWDTARASSVILPPISSCSGKLGWW